VNYLTRLCFFWFGRLKNQLVIAKFSDNPLPLINFPLFMKLIHKKWSASLDSIVNKETLIECRLTSPSFIVCFDLKYRRWVMGSHIG